MRTLTFRCFKRLNLSDHSFVVEVASNDGYLLQYVRAMGIPVLGIEPAKNVAQVAIERGIPSVTAFFGRSLAHKLAREGRRADLLVGNNVLAHVPDINDFVAGIEILLKPGGVVTMEFPHLIRLVEENQFDTIYHEHFSYLVHRGEQIFAAHGLVLFDVEELTTHGGSLRIWQPRGNNDGPSRPNVIGLRERKRAGALER
jgi:2-polyprenyl-3-methyl-5-hydroxy-6-metoxy-1,4-benzoquinol methylase